MNFDPAKEILKIRCHIYILMKEVIILGKIHVKIKFFAPPLKETILRIIEQYKNHPSIVAINKNNLAKQFSFNYIPKSDVERLNFRNRIIEILNLDVSKASQDSDIPTKIIKMNADICNVFNRSLEVGEFPSGLELANVTPVHKKGSRYDKGNYRPVSILPNL